MDWDVDFINSVEKEDVRLIRETLEAKVKAESGQPADAARILWELLVQVRRAKNRRWECMTLVHMGKVYRALRWNIAEHLLEEALELAEEIDLTKAKIMSLVELGEMKCQWGMFKKALDNFNTAIKLVEDNDLESKRFIKLNMVVAFEGLDELNHCIKILKEVIEIDRQIKCKDIEEDIAHFDRLTRALGKG